MNPTSRGDPRLAAIQAPMHQPYHPLYRFYEGGALTRAFRGLPDRPADWWSEDWVGSCTQASDPDPDGRPQGLSGVSIEGLGQVPLAELIEAYPGEMVGDAFATRYGSISGFLVKLALGPGPTSRAPGPCLGGSAPGLTLRQDGGMDHPRHPWGRPRASLRGHRLPRGRG